MHPRAAEFADRARAVGVEVEVTEFPEGTKTAADAAEAIGCDVAQIASSLAFVGDELVIVVTSGANRVDESKLADVRGVSPSDVRMGEPDEIRDTLGWSIGGVPPFCHDADVPVTSTRRSSTSTRCGRPRGPPRPCSLSTRRGSAKWPERRRPTSRRSEEAGVRLRCDGIGCPCDV